MSALFSTVGLYLHVPFCARRCPYCDFAVTPNARPALVADYIAALHAELQRTLAEHARTDARPISTIFFGGGTPTELAPEELGAFVQQVRDNATLAVDTEISLEGNPENLDQAKLAALRAVGFNRLSLGAQSFDDQALQTLGRVHRAADIERVFSQARAAGWNNISLDLIYAVPGQSRASWRETLRRALALEPEHLSAYALTIEGETNFARRLERGELIPLDDDAHADLMQDADEATAEAGIARYEVSNWAQTGRECRHNQNYWRGGDYLAAGCGAHGHCNGVRWWNERDTKSYVLKVLSQESARAGEEILTARQRWNEIVMLGLRTRDGVAVSLAEKFGFDARSEWNGALSNLVERGVVRDKDDRLVLAPEAWAIADAVAARLTL
ncbi:MAG TPA: radical SAM family heme chaperone HemW [Abditibacteriaceae bacterium]|jgi:oxygen-independent coproporphyrinogen-3 oxidase